MRNLIKMPTLTNVVASGHVVLNCPIGMTYDQISFELTNVTPSEMKNFSVKAGSRTIIDCADAQVLADLNTYYGRPEQAGIFTLWFYRPEEKEDVRALTSFGTADIQGLTIEFDLDSGVTSPAMTASAVQRGPQPMGLVTKIRRYPVTFATSGKQAIDNIPRGARITAFHLGKSDVSEVELEVNGGQGPAKIVDASKGLLESVQKQYNRVPVTAKYTHIDMNLLGELAGPMPTAQLQDMRINPTIDSSGALTTIVEYIDGYNGV